MTVVGSPATQQNTSVRFRSFDDPWGHTTDWRYGRGVPAHVTHTRVFDSGPSTIHGVTPVTGDTDVGSPYTDQKTSVQFRSVDDPWGHTADWRYGRGVPVHGTKHDECSIQVIRPMHGVTPQTGVMDVGSQYTYTAGWR